MWREGHVRFIRASWQLHGGQRRLNEFDTSPPDRSSLATRHVTLVDPWTVVASRASFNFVPLLQRVGQNDVFLDAVLSFCVFVAARTQLQRFLLLNF